MPITQIHRVTTTATGFTGAPYFTQMYFDAATGSPLTKHTGVTAFWNALRTRLHQALSFTINGEIDTIDPVTGQIVSQTTVGPEVVNGANIDQPLPPASQALLRFTTGVWVNGRQLRGKVFIPGCVEADSTNGRPEGILLNQMVTASAELTGVNLVVYSRTHRVWQPANGATAWDKFAVLRSRRD